ncbi:hypothetical protein ACP70R_050101 [Stipagrostis hirtigluma subsp. patula]
MIHTNTQGTMESEKRTEMAQGAIKLVGEDLTSPAVMTIPGINQGAAEEHQQVRVGPTAPEPLNDGLKKAAAGGAAKGAMGSFVDWILETLTSCCDVE